MDENRKDVQTPAAADEERDQALFDAIGKDKKRKKRRRWITGIVIVALLAAGITAAVIYGQKKVRDQVSSMNYNTTQVMSYTVDTGSVNTTVSGSGLLSDVGSEKLTLPEGVKVDEVLVQAGDRVEEGDLLCTVEISSVQSAIIDTQAKITDLDKKLRNSAYETAPNAIAAGVNARVKKIYAAVGDDVAACMFEHGALALLSLDGYMAVDLDAADLAEGDGVTVVRADGKELPGTVDRIVLDRATILVTDNGPELDEVVTVRTAGGRELGEGPLYIHSPLRVTGYAGTVNSVYTAENKQTWAGNTLFALKDTAFSGNYESILQERREQEDVLIQLMALYRSGALEAPFSGSVVSIEYKDPNAPSTGDDNNNTSGGNSYGSYTANAYAGAYAAAVSGTGGGSSGSGSETSSETGLLTLSPDESMNVTISVDEKEILALEIGQEAQITVNSIGDIFFGEVTEINRSANSESGVTSYTAVITMPKDSRMLSGMSAKVVVRIRGVENTIQIPEKALHQTREAAFVYTSYNAETGEFGDPVAVIAGLSDGTMVEIVEGLQEGDTVWYTEVFDPWSYYSYGSDGNASGGDAWVSVDASGGDAVYAEYEYASDGDAA
jgi:multidrug efflux pump subunit AcrA (membrane-fusion protein)